MQLISTSIPYLKISKSIYNKTFKLHGVYYRGKKIGLLYKGNDCKYWMLNTSTHYIKENGVSTMKEAAEILFWELL